jgi:hypothetical protein
MSKSVPVNAAQQLGGLASEHWTKDELDPANT